MDRMYRNSLFKDVEEHDYEETIPARHHGGQETPDIDEKITEYSPRQKSSYESPAKIKGVFRFGNQPGQNIEAHTTKQLSLNNSMLSNTSNRFESGKGTEERKNAIVNAMKGTDGTTWELQSGLGNPDKMKFYIVKQPNGGEKRVRIKVDYLFDTQKVSLINLIINSELRKKWEPAQSNFSYKQNTKNWATQRIKYNYNSPLTTVSAQKTKEKQLVLD